MLNPSLSTLKESKLDLVVAGTKSSVLMVESEAKVLAEDVMLGAVNYGHEQMVVAIDAIDELASKAGVGTFEWTEATINEELFQVIVQKFEKQIGEAYGILNKLERRDKLKEIKEDIRLMVASLDDVEVSENDVANIIDKLEHDVVRSSVLSGNKRIDGRSKEDVRPIFSEVDVMPRTHGSALFTRGETQALVVTSLGTERDSQIIDAIEGERRESFMLHYNFPPFCVGETGRVGTPKRREIGHGRLAKRGIQAVMPDMNTFPYVIRVVSEITESNGSSSMASICGTSMSLMNAGVPVAAPVAGIAMGLIKEGNDYVVLSDIMGDEDHLGDMDFKVAGTSEGVTALQMDIKIDGITSEIMEVALAQARDGRLAYP